MNSLAFVAPGTCRARGGLLLMFHPSCHCRGLRTSSRLIDPRQQHNRRVPTIANVTLDDVYLNVRGKRWEGLTRFMANGVPWQPIAEEVLDCAELHLSSLASSVLGERRLQLRLVGAVRIVLPRTWPHSQSAVAN